MPLSEKTTPSDFRLPRRTAVCNRARRASELAPLGCVSPLSFAYNPLGALTAIAYPSGRTVNTWYNAAGRICIVGGLSCTAAKAYAGSTAYAENGALAQDTLRNGLVEATTFNSRFQPTALTATTGWRLLKLTFAYGGGTTNNGNVVSETVLTSGGLNATQSFTYDAYNRLLLAVENPANPANPIYVRTKLRTWWKLSASESAPLVRAAEVTSATQFREEGEAVKRRSCKHD